MTSLRSSPHSKISDAEASQSPSQAFQAESLLQIFLILSALLAIMAWISLWRLDGLIGDLDDSGIFLDQLLEHEPPGALVAVGILLLATLISLRAGADRALERLVRFLASRPKTVAAAALVLLAAGSLFVYQNHPLAMDESMPHFQAQVFAEGEIYGRFPAKLIDRLIPRMFLNRTFIDASLTSGKVISTYYPGFALMLAPFTKLGVPWLLNPLLGAGALLLIFHLARRLLDDPLAPGWAMLLAFASPAFTINAFSYYSLTAHLFLNLLFVTLLLDRSPRLALIAGLVGSLALTLHNPVPHALFAVPWLAWLAFRRQWRCLFALAAGYLPLSLLLGFGWVQVRASIAAENALNAAETGAPIMAAAAGGAVPFLTEVRAFLGVLELPDANFLILRYFAFLKLCLWAVPGLPILAIAGWWALRHKTPVRLLAASAVVTFVFYLFVYFDQGHGWGYRYFHAAWGVLPLLGAAAMAPSSSPHWRRLVGTVAVLSLLAGSFLRCAQVYRYIDRHLDQLATVEGDVGQVRFLDIQSGVNTVDLIQNDPFLDSPTWTFVSFGRALDAAMMRQAFPDSSITVDLGTSTAWTVPSQDGQIQKDPEDLPPQVLDLPVIP